jgi:serine/threonine-protein kinase
MQAKAHNLPDLSESREPSQLGDESGSLPAIAPYQALRRLWTRPHPTYIARHSPKGAKAQLVVVERFCGAAKAGDERAATFGHEARRIATLTSSSLSRVRHVAVRGEDLIVVSDFVDGSLLTDLWRLETHPMPLEIALRVIVDVLAGAAALHGLRDAKQRPMNLAHGQIAPATILFGTDGEARLLQAIASRAPGARAQSSSSTYLAPEAQDDQPLDTRADVFSAGVLLWEALSGRSVQVDGTTRPSLIPAPGVPHGATWAKALVPIAERALAQSPEHRWPTAAAMAAEIRKAAGLRLGSAASSAAWVKSVVGEQVEARRAELEEVSVSQPQSEPAGSPESTRTAGLSTELDPQARADLAPPARDDDAQPRDVHISPPPRAPSSVPPPAKVFECVSDAELQMLLGRFSPPPSGRFQLESPPQGELRPSSVAEGTQTKGTKSDPPPTVSERAPVPSPLGRTSRGLSGWTGWLRKRVVLAAVAGIGVLAFTLAIGVHVARRDHGPAADETSKATAAETSAPAASASPTATGVSAAPLASAPPTAMPVPSAPPPRAKPTASPRRVSPPRPAKRSATSTR